MIRRSSQRDPSEEKVEPKGFDDFDLRLGDIMRGERATLGKSLLDVQRELKIKATYIAAIENSDPTAFDTPGFIAGYVRSYARYLGMDPEVAFQTFCAESNFTTAHGMSSEASSRKRTVEEKTARIGRDRDALAEPTTPFTPARESVLHQVEPRAIASTLVLLALVAGIGYGGYAVLQEVQRVQFAPVEQTPTVFADVDPLRPVTPNDTVDPSMDVAVAPSAEALERLYRPPALDVPVLVPRDGPIAALDPRVTGAFAAPEGETRVIASAAPPGVSAAGAGVTDTPVKVVEDAAPELVLLAVRPAWVRVRAADGSIVFEKILDAGEEYVLPQTEEPPVLRAGNSGSLFFKVSGEIFGPAGPGTSVAKDVVLAPDAVREVYQVADLTKDAELARIVAVAEAQTADPAQPPEAAE